MAELFTVLSSWLQLVVPQPCFDEFFVEHNFLDVPCLKIVLSKCLGYGIIMGSLLVKVPQILKITKAKSAEGISLLGVSLELTAITSTMAYAVGKGFPFSTYGEASFLLVQTWIIAFLLMYYTGQPGKCFIYCSLVAAILAYLFSGLAPMSLLWALQAMVMPNIALGRLIQIVANYRNGSTGQLSAITIFMLFAGALARIFTSFQETGDGTIIATYIVSSLCNGLLAFQVVHYWDSDQEQKSKPKQQ